MALAVMICDDDDDDDDCDGDGDGDAGDYIAQHEAEDAPAARGARMTELSYG